jgi:hypothetical protein
VSWDQLTLVIKNVVLVSEGLLCVVQVSSSILCIVVEFGSTGIEYLSRKLYMYL